MQYRRFGKTEEMVSALAFGCMRLPVKSSNPADIDEEKTIALIRYAIDQGVNYIDTAYPYHGTGMDKGGQSEPVVGKALQDGYRQRTKLATKMPSWMIRTESDMDRYLDEQLERLQTNCIDFYLVHTIDHNFWPRLKKAGISRFMDKAIADGRIKHAGFSFHDKIELFKDIVDYYDWSFCMMQYNYLDETFQAGTAGMQYAAARDMGVAVMEPLRGGNLARLPEQADRLREDFRSKRSAAEWALRWVWNHPEVGTVLSGMNSMEQLQENIRIASQVEASALMPDEFELIEGFRKVFAENIKVPCTYCEYCMPCPTGVWIPRNFRSYNDYYLFGNAQTYAWLAPSQKAAACIQCGLCEERCPQGIAIREELKKVSELLDKK